MIEILCTMNSRVNIFWTLLHTMGSTYSKYRQERLYGSERKVLGLGTNTPAHEVWSVTTSNEVLGLISSPA